jgi:hypothetical protein
LIHDNSHWVRYAARIVDYENGEQQVVPFTTTHVNYSLWLYRLQPRGRDWLTDDEVGELNHLIEVKQARTDKLPQRLSAATYFGEYALRVENIEPFIVMLFMAVEALINTDPHRATAQVTKRLPMLAESVGLQLRGRALFNFDGHPPVVVMSPI